MRGPLATARYRARARRWAIIKPLLIGAVVTFFLLGAMYTDHQYLMTYGY